jgi:hypothetical protein
MTGTAQATNETYYVTLAQLGATFVGILGAFFTMRVQVMAQEWRAMRIELDQCERIERAARLASETVPLNQMDKEAAQREHRRAIEALAPLWERRNRTTFPIEIFLQLLLLGAAMYFGVWVPLSRVGDLNLNERLTTALPLVMVVVLLWISMSGLALSAFYRLRRHAAPAD